MKLKDKLIKLRKDNVFTQEKLAERLNVTRQTISNWEQEITYPSINQIKDICKLYNVSMYELIGEKEDYLTMVNDVIKNSDPKKESSVNWTKAWGRKYPVLNTYKSKVDVKKYAVKIRELLDDISSNYGYNSVDSMLVLKDILASEWKDNISKK